MALLGFDTLFRELDAQPPRAAVAAAGAEDPTVLEALTQAAVRNWVQPVLVGREPEIRRIAAERQFDLSHCRIVDTHDAAVAAVAEISAGRAELLMKGQIATPALMKAVLQPAAGLRTGRTICQVVLMEIRRDARQFLLADTGITIQPTLDQKADILRSVIDVARALGAAAPRVALMAATEKVTESMPDTLDAAALARRGAAGEFGAADVAGPLSFDLAYAADAGEKKRIDGAVVGAADALLFPNLLSANLTVKAIMYTADCQFGGLLCGAAVPVVFMSRADNTATRLNSLALALRSRKSEN